MSMSSVKTVRRLFVAAALTWLGATSAHATAIRLESAASVALGSFFEVAILADIDAADQIIGFGFDVDLGAGLQFLGFTAGPGFADDPIYLAPFSDADGIRGASGGSLLFGDPVYGTDLLLGRILLQATALGMSDIGLSADDLGFNFTEGLIPLSLDQINFMPLVSPLVVDVQPGVILPLPGTLAHVALALAALAAATRGATRRRAGRNGGYSA
jgi:hypothetical protein